MATPFSVIYDRFFGKITDDMYLEWTKEDTERDAKNILLDAIPHFEFPRFELYNYKYSDGTPSDEYHCDLTDEEIDILAILMLNVWVQRQVTSIENTRMKYSGSDFKMTSQANHLDKLMKLKQEVERQDRHYQRLYKRRVQETSTGRIKSNWFSVMEKSTFDY